MATTSTHDKHTTAHLDETVERVREFNEQLVESGRQAGVVLVDTYEKTLKSWADYQDKLADQTHVDAVATIARAQAQYTRTVANASAGAARELLGA